MSAQDQCPSTTGKAGKPALPGKGELSRAARDLPRLNGGATGRKIWRSPEELADTPEFRDWLEREFPAGASELDGANDGETRRDFLKLIGASLALAGAATIPGCRRPDHRILAYSAEVPEDVVPGKPLYYATSMPLPGGGAEGLLVETHEGRPTKIEGNPLHPINQGKSSIWSQAAVLSLYDPDRLKAPVYRHGAAREARSATWEDFAAWSGEHFRKFDASRGRGLAFIVDKKTSPSRDAARDAILRRWPNAAWIAYDALQSDAPVEGARLAFGRPVREVWSLDRARVIVSLDRDFLCTSGGREPAGLVHSRQFAATRRILDANAEMSRLYAVEGAWSLTGAAADHRMTLAPSQIPAFAVALARAVSSKLGGGSALAGAIEGVGAPGGFDGVWIDACADDLVAARGASAVLAGPNMPPEVHALVHALNAALGNVGRTISYLPMGEEEAASSIDGIRRLAEAMDRGEIDTLVAVESNPCFTAPGDLDFAAAYERVPWTVCLGVEASETAALSRWELNGAHFLEAWGDTEAHDGTVAPIQPMIAPLYDGVSELEFLDLLARGMRRDDRGAWTRPAGYDLVREVWRGRAGGDLERFWRRALHDGVVQNSQRPAERLSVDPTGVAGAVSAMRFLPAPTMQALDVVFQATPIDDGRFANNAWLQELPQNASRVVWDNPVLMSPATATALGVEPVGYSEKDPNKVYTKSTYPHGRMVRVTINGRTLDIAAWIMPGMADHTIVLSPGYGRDVAGRVGDGVGFDVYRVRDTEAAAGPARATVARNGSTHLLASTQTHWSLEGRHALLRQIDLKYWNQNAAAAERAQGVGRDRWAEAARDHDLAPYFKEDTLYGTITRLSLAERMGELSHTPPTLGIYENPYNRSIGDPDAGDRDARGRPPAYAQRPQWGMSIDLATCTGCGVCTVACHAENNIPVVGKKEVAKGREMAWIRVDRYFTGHDVNHPEEMVHQPVPCMHCENAPCETVCPVNATVHGPEGINYMVYNRCIGTRYCANNCPYKVRRFNFFDYGVKKFNGDWYGKETFEGVAPDRGGITGSGRHNKVNPNLIPPRLRERLGRIEQMQKNPDVTVRSRGVMEKCSYCIQRINEARIEMKLHDVRTPDGNVAIPDGFIQTACQQACPSGAIVFGDLLDPESRVHRMANHQRSYMMLGFLNTRPRTTYMIGARNPNERIRPSEDPFHHADDHNTGHGSPGTPDHKAGEGSHTFIDPGQRARDRGYAVSLRVLPAGAGVHA